MHDSEELGPVEAISVARPQARFGRLTISGAWLADLLLATEPLWVIPAYGFVCVSLIMGNAGYSWAGVGVMASPFVLRRARHGYFSIRTPFDLPIALLLVAGLLGVYFSPDRHLSWAVFQSLLAGVLFYYAVANYSHPPLLVKWGLTATFVIVLGVTSVVFLQSPSLPPFLSDLGVSPQSFRLPTFPNHANPAFGLACGVAIASEAMLMIVASVALFSSRIRVRLIAGALTLPLLAVLVLSPCRATWLVLAVGMVFLLAWRSRWLLLSVPLWIGVVFWSVTARLGYSFADVKEIASDIAGRLVIWQDTIQMLADRPFTGWGLGSWLQVYPSYASSASLPTSPHNAYLQLYSDMGLVGAIALIWAAVLFAKVALQTRHLRSTHEWYGLTVGALAAILVAAVYGLVEASVGGITVEGVDSYYYIISPMLWMLGAFLVLVQRVVTADSQEEPVGMSHPSEGSQLSGPDQARIVAAIPCFNEERFVGDVVSRAKQHVAQVIVIDDGSTDATAEIAEACGAIVIRHAVNRGKGMAMNTALAKAKELGVDVLVLLDGDGQQEPAEIPLLLEPVLSHQADVVVGSRFLSTKNSIPRYRVLGQHILTLATNLGSGVKLTDCQSGFRSLSKKAISRLHFSEKDLGAVESEMQFLIKENNLKVTEVPITARYQGEAKRSPLIQGLGTLSRIVWLSIQRRLLRRTNTTSPDREGD